jgi:hypothetical protein
MSNRTVRVAAVVIAVVIGGTIATTSFASNANNAQPKASRAAHAAKGGVEFINAVPKMDISVAIDGKEVVGSLALGDLGDPYQLAPGSHEVTFSNGSEDYTATVDVSAGQSSDVVVHRPAEVGGTPVVSVYPTPSEPIDPGKARVLLAHTATVAPADVVVDGQTVFTNIANGEFAQADVAAGGHEVSLLPAGVTGKPILGPLDVTLEAGTITAVYAYGNPKDGSMNVIVRTTGGTSSGAEPPTEIDTGSAGLVGRVHVWTFSGR